MPMTTGKNQGALTITLLLAVMGILAYRVLHARTTIQHLNSELAQDQRSLAVLCTPIRRGTLGSVGLLPMGGSSNGNACPEGRWSPDLHPAV